MPHVKDACRALLGSRLSRARSYICRRPFQSILVGRRQVALVNVVPAVGVVPQAGGWYCDCTGEVLRSPLSSGGVVIEYA